MSWLLARKWLVGAIGIAVVGLGLGLGLSLGGGGSAPAHGRAASSGPSGAGSGSGTGSGSPSSSGAGAGAASSSIRACTAADVTMSTGAPKTVSGHTGIPLVFTSHASFACRLSGYPGVAAFTASGTPAGSPLELPGGFVGGVGPNGLPGTVVVQPGTKASAMIEAASTPLPSSGGSAPSHGNQSSTTTTTRPPRKCTEIAQIKVTVPGDTTVMEASVALTDCYGFLVHPFVPGTSGSAV